MIFHFGDPHMEIHMRIPTVENQIPIPIPFQWVWGSIWGFPYPRQPCFLDPALKVTIGYQVLGAAVNQGNDTYTS